MAVSAGMLVLTPSRMREWLTAFPRDRTAGWILTAIDLAWVGWLLTQTPLGRFENLRGVFYLLVPVSFCLVVKFVDELLAPRAMGGLMLLFPAPVLALARWHPSAWRYVVIVLMYLAVVKGIVLMLSPYRFRLVTERFMNTDPACRLWGTVGCITGLVVLGLGLLVF